MHPVWRDVLIASSARIGEDGIPVFPDTGADPGNACLLFDLSHLGLLAVRGEDAADFLQGQLSNDVRELSATHAQWSSHCSHKGRMLASFLIIRIGDVFYLQLPSERVPDLLKRLRMFVLRSRVVIEDVGDPWVRMAITGECAEDAVRSLGLTVPESENGVASDERIAVLRLPGPTPRLEIMGPPEPLSDLWNRLRTRAVPGNREAWTLLDIRAGIPSVLNATADSFVPQMANLHLIDGLSFHKGCYTGQEVVARMQYLGKLKRRMYLAELEADRTPQPGDTLFSPDSTSRQGSGAVVVASPVGPGRYELLAVVEVKAAEAGEVRLGENGPLLRLKLPPYGFPSEDATAA